MHIKKSGDFHKPPDPNLNSRKMKLIEKRANVFFVSVICIYNMSKEKLLY